jgi:hypothetical protein
MDDPDSTLSGAVRIISVSEGEAGPAAGSPLTPFSPVPADSDIGNLLRSAIVGRYPVTKDEEWTLLDLTAPQIRRVADVYERLLAERDTLLRSSERATEVLTLLRRSDTRKNREWNDAIDTVAKSLDEI